MTLSDKEILYLSSFLDGKEARVMELRADGLPYSHISKQFKKSEAWGYWFFKRSLRRAISICRRSLDDRFLNRLEIFPPRRCKKTRKLSTRKPKKSYMPKFTFTDQENKSFEPLPPGDYVARVIECEFGISKGGKTSGADTMELTLEVEAKDRTAKVYETLIFHQSCAWKVDTFVKSFNLLVSGKAPGKDEQIDFSEQMVVGLRGWVTLKVEDYTGRSGEKRQTNRVAVFITNKEKLSKVIEVDPMAAAPAAKDDWN